MTEAKAGLSAVVLGTVTLSGVNDVVGLAASVAGLIVAAPHIVRRIRSLLLKIKR